MKAQGEWDAARDKAQEAKSQALQGNTNASRARQNDSGNVARTVSDEPDEQPESSRDHSAEEQKRTRAELAKSAGVGARTAQKAITLEKASSARSEAASESNRRRAKEMSEASFYETPSLRFDESGQPCDGKHRLQAAEPSSGNVATAGIEQASADERKARTELARSAGVGARTAQKAITLEKESPELFEKVCAGDVSLNQAYRQVTRDKASGGVGQRRTPKRKPASSMASIIRKILRKYLLASRRETMPRKLRASATVRRNTASNLHRRHLSESQRAMVAARVATLPAHRPATESAPNEALSQPAAADRLNVGRGSVQRARQVLESGNSDPVAAVDGGYCEAARVSTPSISRA